LWPGSTRPGWRITCILLVGQVATLRALLFGVSAQRPSHSIFLGGEQLPLEARMGGIFLGFLCGLVLLALLGRLGARHTPRGPLFVACVALVAVTGLDGLNAFLFDGNLPHLYAPSTAARLLTGLAAGLGLCVLAVPVVASLAAPAATDEASIEDPVELGAGLAMVGLLGAVMLAGVGALLWPLALAMLIGVVLAFGVANVYVIVLATGRAHVGSLLSALGLSLVELVALSALRTWLIAAFGFTWGV
jgi:uncharacterized membrane protein